MLSDKFRRQLCQEAGQWQAEGLINSAQYQQLASRYQFDALETTARNRFVMILIGFGSVLLGLGVITFVAANWQEWSRELRVILLLSLFVGVNIGGFYLWRQRGDRWQRRLGQGLLLLGALTLGANMALMSQMFHIGGDTHTLYLAWSIGVLTMAYSLRLTSLALAAILLMGLGYWQGVSQLFMPGEASWSRLMLEHMPLLATLGFIPLAHWCRSRAVFVGAAIAIISSLQVSLSAFQNLNFSLAWIAAIACALPPALLWGYDDALWSRLIRRPVDARKPFQPLARAMALLFLGTLFYILSFHWLWDTSTREPVEISTLLSWAPLVDVVILSSLTVVEWLRLARLERRPSRRRTDLTTNVVACLITITALVVLWHLGVSPIGVFATFIFNILLLLLTIGLIREGLAQSDRRTFWLSVSLLSLQIFSRLLEYETGLVFKALAFILCGIGVIAAGLWFERYVRTLNSLPSPPSLPEENTP